MKRLILIAALALVPAAIPVTTATGATGAPGLDQEYLTTAIQGDRFEIDGGAVALKNSQNATIRALAMRLIKDHKKSLGEASKLARSLHIKIPRSPTPPEQWEIQTISGFQGAAFDKLYASLEVADHKQDIDEATAERDMGSNASVRKSAAKELPVLTKHLQLSRAALRAVGG
jgi:putative membrane protein